MSSSWDVFVSYASPNKQTADELVTRLEESGTRCWIAPRNIDTGRDYGEQIIYGIRNSVIFVLLFSSQANDSEYVIRELDRAISFNKRIVPINIDASLPTGGMDFRLCTVQWIESNGVPLPEKVVWDALAVLAAAKENESSAGPPEKDAPPPPRKTVRFGGTVEALAAETVVLDLLRQWGLEAGQAQIALRLARVAEQDRPVLASYHQALTEVTDVGDAGPKAGQPAGWLGWHLAAQAFLALRNHQHAQVHRLLAQAETLDLSGDAVLHATLRHCGGAALYYGGNPDAALPPLFEALSLLPPKHPGVIRLHELLGMVYASKDNFHIAREFYARVVGAASDDATTARCHGQMGRLHFAWGQTDRAAEHFREDLTISARIGDQRGEAQMYNCLAWIEMARKAWDDAADLLRRAILRSEKNSLPNVEAFARKDLALTYLHSGRLDEAEVEINRAAGRFESIHDPYGMAHCCLVTGMIRRGQGRFEEAESSLGLAWQGFSKHQDKAEAARAQLELARTCHAQGSGRTTVSTQLIEALTDAEQSRRASLVREIETELEAVDALAYHGHIYQRARGRGVTERTGDLFVGQREDATVLFLDLHGSTQLTARVDPEDILMTLNHMMAELAQILKAQKAVISGYRGEGFMAVLRGPYHPRRAVLAALQMTAAIEAVNRPRAVLQWPLLQIRIGISSGEVCLGNVGTYDKMDFTAVGTPANLAAQLEGEAEPGGTCISQATYERVQHDFVFREGNPRKVRPKALPEQNVWDVVGEKPMVAEDRKHLK